MRAIVVAVALPWCADAMASPDATAPLQIEAGYIGEAWRNVRGGMHSDGTYVDNFDVMAKLDAERLFGWTGTTVLVSALYNNDSTLTQRIVGDLQTLSNIDTPGATRLYEAWVERKIEAGTIKVGLVDLNTEFDVNETGLLFINSSHGIGPEFAQVGENGPSIFPIIGLGTVMRWDFSDRVHARLAAFEATAGDPHRPHLTTVELDRDEGALMVGELTLRPTQRSRYLVGLWRHTGHAKNFADEDTWRRHTSLGVYGLGEGTLIHRDQHALSGFLRLGIADADVHQIHRYLGAGLVWSGPLLASAVHEEQLGVAIAAAENGRPFRRARAELGSSVDRHETAIELTYRLQALSWLALQPDLQYIIDPGTDPSLDDSWVIGLRFELTWSLDAG